MKAKALLTDCWPNVHFLEDRKTKRDMNGHPARLGVAYGRPVESSSRSWLYIQELLLPKFITILGWHRAHTLIKNSSPICNRIRAASRETSSKKYALIRVDTDNLTY